MQPALDTTAQARLLEQLRLRARLASAATGTAEWLFTSPEDLVLSLGRWGRPHTLPAGATFGLPGRCFANANLYAARHPGLYYVEGYALDRIGFAHPHAWCVDETGTVHDNTWEEPGLAYAGLPFTRDYAQNAGTDRLVHDHYRDHCRILRVGFPAGAIAEVGLPLAFPATA
ncbi:hypothetical protein JOF53_006565 [Crossiella equi]|uniref:Uncharacterized protein n=1 Tax=Crossiella equi TaxID=130796 RepID=A0ABS5AM98_9PSEU|nr:hypothetical protein [Crossiella equi]MBP2477693.1 hypothetical protein [Crossiella equi]